MRRKPKSCLHEILAGPRGPVSWRWRCLLLTFVNASWLAPKPVGGVKLIAHRGVSQLFDHEGVEPRYLHRRPDRAAGPRLSGEYHPFDGGGGAARRRHGRNRHRADRRRQDRRVPRLDRRLPHRRQGRYADKTLADLQALDIGHGYTADEGKTFPFRGRRKDRHAEPRGSAGGAPQHADHVQLQGQGPGRSRPARRRAQGCAARCRGAARRFLWRRPGRSSASAPISPRRGRGARSAPRRCTKDYVLYGWTSIVPESCRGGTIDRADQPPMDVLGLAQPADPADGGRRRPGDRHRPITAAMPEWA